MIRDEFALVDMVADQIRFFEWTDPTAPPIPISACHIEGITRFVPLGHLLLATGSGLTIIDASDPFHPEIIGGLPDLSGIQFIGYYDGFVYFIHFRDGLVIIDISDPTSPTLVSCTPLPPVSQAALCWPTIITSSSHDDGSLLVDVSDPVTPTVVVPPLRFGTLFGVGDHFISAVGSSLQIYACSMMMRPRLVSTISTGIYELLLHLFSRDSIKHNGTCARRLKICRCSAHVRISSVELNLLFIV